MRSTNNNTLTAGGNAPIESVNEASFLFGEMVRREMEKIGMRCSYRHVLKPLVENASLTQLELVKITNLKAPTISITLRNMEREGIVKREKNDSDRRETHVAITDKGKKMYTKLLAAIEKAEQVMLKGLSEKELKSVAAALDKMSANLRAEMK
ncbi:MAG: MarR family transcriptional regulator [Oscillospiraceae bacterium]|nr:MarR family transcriptional regulator [Oscillospiraceae bacterium]